MDQFRVFNWKTPSEKYLDAGGEGLLGDNHLFLRLLSMEGSLLEVGVIIGSAFVHSIEQEYTFKIDKKDASEKLLALLDRLIQIKNEESNK